MRLVGGVGRFATLRGTGVAWMSRSAAASARRNGSRSAGVHSTPPGGRVMRSAGTSAHSPTASRATRRDVGTRQRRTSSSAAASRSGASGSSASQLVRTKRRRTRACVRPAGSRTSRAWTADDAPPSSARTATTSAAGPTAAADQLSARAGGVARSSSRSASERTKPCGGDWRRRSIGLMVAPSVELPAVQALATPARR